MIPGPGERIFAGSRSRDVICHSYPKFENVINGLQYVGIKVPFRYPVPNLAIFIRAQDA